MNSFYDNYQKRQEQNRQQTEKRERSFGEQMHPVAVSGNISKGMIHIFSFSAAVTLPAFGFELLFGNFIIGLITGAILFLALVEIPKWATINTIFENKFDSDVVSYGLCIFGFVLMTVSIVSSTFGVPILVDRMSPDAIVIDMNVLKMDYKQQAEKATAFYIPQIEKHSKDAQEYFTSNRKQDRVTKEWRLSSSKAVKYPYNEMLKAGKAAQSALNNRLDSIHSNLNKALALAASKNDKTTATHNFKKANAGNIAFWVMLVLELCYVLIVWGLKYYEHRSKEERKGLDQTEPKETESNSTEQSRIVSIQTESNKTEQSRPTEKQAVATKRKIGFEDEPNKTEQKQHGQIFTPMGSTTKKMYYLNKKGAIVEKSKADLVRLRNRPTATEDFKDKIDKLLTEF